jgi:hypothetical protein
VLTLHFVYDGSISTQNADMVFTICIVIFHKAEGNSE